MTKSTYTSLMITGILYLIIGTIFLIHVHTSNPDLSEREINCHFANTIIIASCLMTGGFIMALMSLVAYLEKPSK